MATSLDTGVPWVMCQRSDAPNPVIHTASDSPTGKSTYSLIREPGELVKIKYTDELSCSFCLRRAMMAERGPISRWLVLRSSGIRKNPLLRGCDEYGAELLGIFGIVTPAIKLAALYASSLFCEKKPDKDWTLGAHGTIVFVEKVRNNECPNVM
ncbi:hypothetical protein Syun_021086 [Stephania yunnanensis]|uniref:Uncharacterized protein n=1 Tax=Stephania yunnanensis TaxID=152371 RepID=A0AAP0IF22_9MAGN